MWRAFPLTVLVLTLGFVSLGPAIGHAAQSEEKVEEFTMVIGEELAFNGVREFAIENQQILTAAVTRDKKGVIVRAMRPGVSKILLRGASATDKSRALEIVVTLRDPKTILADLEELLRPFPSIHPHVNKGRVLLEGVLKTDQDLLRLREVERRYDGQVVVLATVAIAEAPRRMMVRLDLHHVSVRRRFNRKLGMRYPTGITGSQAYTMAAASLSLGPSWVSQTAVIGDLLPSLDFSEANGYVKLKRTDTLITENGAKAVYREGSELAIRLTGALGAGQLERVFYGAELNVTPHLSTSNDAVTLDIDANITQRDNAATQDGIPGRDVSHVHTTVHIPIGQSAMLAGVDLQQAGVTRTGLPWLSRIPILGYLFGSDGVENETSYGVVFITPTVMQEGAPQSREALERALHYFDKPTKLRLQRDRAGED